MSAIRWRTGIVVMVTGTVAAAMFMIASNAAHAATLFNEDFEGGTAGGWSTSGGSWSVVSDDGQVYRQSSTGSDAKAQVGQTDWTDQAVEARVKPLTWSGSDRSAGVLARAQNMTNYYQLGVTNSGQVQLGKRAGGGFTTLATAAATVTTGTWYTLRLEVFGSNLTGYIDGRPVVSATDGTFSAGRSGLYTRYASSAFDDVVVTDVAGPGPTDPPTDPTDPPDPGDCQAHGSATGFASVNAWSQNGTTGGAGGATVEVDTATELIDAIAQSGPLTVCITGMITLPAGMYDVTSDKSIVGLGADSGITGGGLNIGLPTDDDITEPPSDAVHNVIIQNLVFRGASDDSINVQMFSHHVWIDHNDLADGYDGLIDIKRGSSYVTVSWNHTHDHTKNMLLGHADDNAAQDVGRLKVTYDHNWYDRTPQRNPRVRFGDPVHIYNNYYLDNSDTGPACQADSGCMVEGNYFEEVEEPVTNQYSGPSGKCVARDNVFVGEEAGDPVCSGTVEEPGDYYSYTLDNPNDVKAIVMAGAGTGTVATGTTQADGGIDQAGPDGFASVDAMGQNGTTGGAGGPTVTVTSGAELAEYAGENTPYIIQVSGTITLPDTVRVVADKTIVGLGDDAEILGGTLQMGTSTRPGNNVIVRNLTFRDAEDDSVSVHNASHHVWIDHNEFYPAADGSVDIKRMSSYVTVSWNWFHGTDKSMLLGHSDSFTDDIGRLKVTYHHNFFDGSNQRHPRVRFGEPVHVYNNYYLDIGLYGIASTMDAGVLVEGNYFDNVANPCHSASGYDKSGPGRLVERDNVFDGSGTCETNGVVAEPRDYYEYTLDDAESVPQIVTLGAGVGRI